jgi:maleate isomerase
MNMKKRLLARGSLAPLKRIGFITPSSNAALEPLTSMMLDRLSDLVSVHFSRLTVRTLTLDERDLGQFQVDKVLKAAAELKDLEVDAILWNGTSGGWTGHGLQADRELCRQITEATGVPASTSSLAQAEVFALYGVKRYGLAVPYVEGPTRKMLQTYADEGFEGVSHAAMGEHVNTRVGATPFDKIRALLRAADSPQAQCLMVGCTNWPAAPLLDAMEAELGKPIFDSIAVTLWKALRMVAVDRPIHGWGALLRRDPTLAALDQLLADLRQDTGAHRTTIRFDLPRMNFDADDVYAESVAPGVPPLKLDSSLNQRSLGTVQWLERHREMLVQDDCINAEIPPPKALMNVYGVKAQMLEPLVWGQQVVGWISVHHIGSTRQWRAEDKEALRKAAVAARELLENAGWVEVPVGSGTH